MGIVKGIRVIASGKFVQSYCGSWEDIVLTISDGLGTAFVVPEEGNMTHADAEQAKSLLNRIQIGAR